MINKQILNPMLSGEKNPHRQINRDAIQQMPDKMGAQRPNPDTEVDPLFEKQAKWKKRR
jgi:hypothetical protein